MNKAFNNVIKNHITLTVLTVLAVVLLSGGVTYALFIQENRNAVNQKIAVGTLDGNITSINGAMVLNDLYPEKSENITDKTKRFEFTISNSGNLDIDYKIYLKDATDTLLANTTAYSKYKRLDTNYYKYINYKLDGASTLNLQAVKEDDQFVLFSGSLKAGTSEDHYLQFFLDSRDTTEEGAPNDINGSILSLDIYMDGAATEIELTAEDTLKTLKVTAKEGNPAFTNIATTDEGVYAMADDYGTSYYYRGAVPNNYVKYGRNKSGQEMWWRIIRINGDGSLRIIYDGTQGWANGTKDNSRYAITSQPWNASPNYNDAKYVGWMFGGAQGETSTSKEQAQTNETNSDAKTAVDNWYKENIVDTGYGDNVVDRVFCNDRSIDSGPGYGTGTTYYGAYARLGAKSSSVVTPKFTCETKNDAFTVEESETTNGALEYPVGLITGDEIVTAGSGGYNKDNTSYYLYKSGNYRGWSLSPYHETGSYAAVFGVYTNGNEGNVDIYNTGGALAPVINLSAEYASTLRGEGTIESPFQA